MSEQVDSQIRTFRELLNDYSEHTAIDWLREVLVEAERESAERQRLAQRNHDLTHKLIELSDEIEAVHQAAHAVAKRAFLQKLDKLKRLRNL